MILHISTFVTRWVALISLCVGVGASQTIPLSVLARKPHRGLAREISHETWRGRGKKGRGVKRRNELAEGGRTEKWTEQTSQQSREGGRTGQSAGESRWLLGCGDSEAGLANVRGRVSVPRGFVGISLDIHACTSPQMHKMLGKYHTLLSSCVWSLIKSVFICSLFFHPLGCVCCVLCVRKEMWNTRDERNH